MGNTSMLWIAATEERDGKAEWGSLVLLSRTVTAHNSNLASWGLNCANGQMLPVPVGPTGSHTLT